MPPEQFLGMYVTFQDILEGEVSREALHNLLAPLASFCLETHSILYLQGFHA